MKAWLGKMMRSIIRREGKKRNERKREKNGEERIAKEAVKWGSSNSGI